MDYNTLLVIASAIMQVIIDYQTMKGKTEDEVKAMFRRPIRQIPGRFWDRTARAFLKGE